MLAAIWGSRISLAMAKENSRGVGLQRKPVTPSLIVSTGPPLLHPMTGLWAAIASKGTMPKCSSYISPRVIFTSFFFGRSDRVGSDCMAPLVCKGRIGIGREARFSQ